MWRFLHEPTRLAWFAAASQQAQLETLTTVFGGQPVTARLFGADGTTLRRVLTLPALTINTGVSPRRIDLGAYVADSPITTGDLGRWVLRNSAGVDILEAPARVSGGTINHAGGNIKTLCPPSISGVTVQALAGLPAAPVSFTVRQVEVDGITTPGTIPAAVYRNGALYTGWVDTQGRSGVTKFVAPSTQQRTVLSVVTDYNSHNNCALDWDADGRLIAAWARHLDGDGVQIRRASAVESVTGGFTTAVQVDDGDYVSYVQLWRLSQTNRLYLMTRVTSAGSFARRVASSANDGATWDALRTWVNSPGFRAYPIPLSDGVSRVYLVFNSSGPQEGDALLYAGYMQLDGSNVERFYRMDGTDVGTAGLTPANATVMYAGPSRTWPYDLVFGPDGEVWCTWFRFVSTTDHRIMFQKTVSGRTAWAPPVELVATGGPLYTLETYSHAGAVFDKNDPRDIYLCRKTGGGRHEVYRWRTTTNGASWSEVAQITSGSTGENFQPVSPPGHGGDVPVVWSHGTYTFWADGFDTEFLALVRD